MKKAEDWKDDIRRIANLVIDTEDERKIICIMGIAKVELQKQICAILGESIAIRNKEVLVIHTENDKRENIPNGTILDVEEKNTKWIDIVMKTKEISEVYAVPQGRRISELLGHEFAQKLKEITQSYDYIIIDNCAIEQQAESIAIAAECDETILLIEKGTVKGNRAMHLKRELDMNKVHVLGSIFIK